MSGDERDPGDPKGLTSEELFGDLVDAPAKPARKQRRAGPIRVKVSEPGHARAAPAAPVLAEDLARLLDAFQETREDVDHPTPPPATKASTQREEPPTEPSLSLTPTPFAVEPLPDLPELHEAEQMTAEAEARSDLVKLTSRLPEPRVTSPGPVAVDLATLAEHAIQEATPTVPTQSRGDALADVARRAAPAEPAHGLLYGPYRLVDKIAIGGMAEVFKAKRSGVAGFEKVVAVKRILPHLSYNREFVEMFIDEAKMVAGLQHPNVVQIYDLGRIGGSYYIAMEYVEGADLRSILKRLRERELRMPVDLALLVAGKVAAALDHAHRKKDAHGQPMQIVHRDVSPQNILISFDGDVKLTDFGIAKAATKASVTEKGALRGKLMYMSPEQAWGRPMDHRSDLFALGIVLYEMLTDQRPFSASSEMSLLDKVRLGELAPPRALVPGLPTAVEKVVLKALSKEPQRRHRDAGALRQELDELRAELYDADEKDLARFLRILLETPPASAAPRGSPEPAPGLEVDLGGEGELPEALEEKPVTLPELTTERLLRRFG